LETVILRGEEIRYTVQMSEILEAVEQVFIEKAMGRTQMPPKVYLYYKKYNGDLRVMPSHMETLDVSAVKVVNVHPQNRQFGLPTVMATILLIDPKTGFPLSIMDGTWITAMRTGAASGMATKYLARKDSRTLGLIGAGAQAETQLMAIASVIRLEGVKVWSLYESESLDFVRRWSEAYHSVNFSAEKDIQHVVQGSDVVVTVTPSRQPLVMDEWVEAGTHINAVGADAPGKQELDPMILRRSRIFVDDMEQACHSGEVNMPLAERIISREDILGELGEVIAQRIPGRISEDEVTVFCATGLAIEDAITARLVYQRAIRSGTGTKIRLIS
jgi:alanine dehydrogenase